MKIKQTGQTVANLAHAMNLQIGTVRKYIQKASRLKTATGQAIAKKNIEASRSGNEPARYTPIEVKVIYAAGGRIYVESKRIKKTIAKAFKASTKTHNRKKLRKPYNDRIKKQEAAN